MFALKPISHDSVPGALAKAERYRLLNEPHEAESICRDILSADSGNQAAQVMLVLSLTDQFAQRIGPQEALEVAEKLEDTYQRAYYSGIVHERHAIALSRQDGSHTRRGIYSIFLQAMECYEKAEAIRPADNEDAILRWNTCVRFLRRNWGFR